MAPPLVSMLEDLTARTPLLLYNLFNLFYYNFFLRHAQLLRLRIHMVSTRITTATFDLVGCLHVTGLLITRCDVHTGKYGIVYTGVIKFWGLHGYGAPRPHFTGILGPPLALTGLPLRKMQ